MSQAAEVLDSTFQAEVLEAELPVLVDFWAPWCGPCKAMGPTIDRLAESYAGKLKVVKHNTQDHAEVPSALGIMSIPTLIVFKGGQEVWRHVGLLEFDDLEKEVTPHLG
jgi:thioredoxin 1